MPNFPTLQGMVKELCNYKVLNMGQNLHANMEGFRRAGHILSGIACRCKLPQVPSGIVFVNCAGLPSVYMKIFNFEIKKLMWLNFMHAGSHIMCVTSYIILIIDITYIYHNENDTQIHY